MDRRLWLALACVTSVAFPSFAQFAVDRNPTPAPIPAPSSPPAVPIGTAPIGLPTFQPEGQPAPAATPPAPRQPAMITPQTPQPVAPTKTNHPMAITPQAGEYFVSVKSYVGPESMALAERLAKEIQATYKVPVYLFEYHSEEKQKLQAEQEAVRARAHAEALPFLQKREEMRKKAEAEGRIFVDDGPPKVRVQKLLNTVPEQWAVVVGGYKDMATAKKAADVIHNWPAPTDTTLMDTMTYLAKKDAKDKVGTEVTAPVNPYVTAMVVRNPSLPRNTEQAADPALWRWNEGEELCVLNCKKAYTLVVKSFSVPVMAVGHEQDLNVMQTSSSGKTGGPNNAQLLTITAIQARNLAKMLRDLKDSQGKPVGFEAYVLHMKTGSIVCVGQYDSMDDEALAQTAGRIANYKLNLTRDAAGQQAIKPGESSFFDQVSVLKIPRK